MIKEKNTISENLWILAGKHNKFMFDFVEKITQLNSELNKLKIEVEKLKKEQNEKNEHKQ